MSDRAKAIAVLLALAFHGVPLVWERIFPVHIRTEAEYRAAMDEFDKLANAFDEKLTVAADEKRMKELADSIGRYDEQQLIRKPAKAPGLPVSE